MNEKELSRACRWIFRNRNVPDWWTPLVITEYNPDKTNPKLPVQTAMRIFEVLEKEELFTRDGEVNGLPRYKFNFAELKKWKKKVSFIENFIPTWIINFVLAWKKLLIFCALIIATTFLEDCSSRVSDLIWPKILPTELPMEK